MKNWTYCFLLLPLIGFIACNNDSRKNIPDVSNVQVSLSVERFDTALFSIDTNKLQTELTRIKNEFPGFYDDYIYNILGIEPSEDSVVAKLPRFIHDYMPIYDTVEKVFPSMKKAEDEVKHGLQFIKYYFPQYPLPQHLVTFVGPVEGYANVLTRSGIAVGLQLYMGRNYSFYQTAYFSEVYPSYQSRRFEPAYIPVNCMKNLVDDIYPDNSDNMPLVYQMIEAGKRLYFLDQVLPDTPDSLKTGYTQAQLDGCYANEGGIWNYFTENNLLYSKDPSMIRDYMNDGPKTEVLGEASPGFIGQFVGWQIIKKWMENKKDIQLPQLLKTPAKQIFEEAKYKPH